ncbi:MAG TPA: hypothetical protein VMP00_02475 [Burkholderiales bacterium]|nr:hypothetical protein [Burkholderiales bacterium]
MPLDRAMGTHARMLTLRTLFPFLLIAGLTAMLISVSDAARTFPANAQRGEIKAHQYPYYTIGKVTYRMGAGGRIYNEQNMIVMPASVLQNTAHVMYTVDLGGNLHRMWLLTPAEAAIHKLPKSDDPKEEKKKEGQGLGRD